MELAVISGTFALIGAVLGSVVAGYVQRSVRERNARSERIEAAIRSVAIAMTARDIPWGINATCPPSGFADADWRDLEKTLYRGGLEKLAAALADAKRDLAILATDGYSIRNEWLSNSIGLIGELDQVYIYLLTIRAPRRRRFANKISTKEQENNDESRGA